MAAIKEQWTYRVRMNGAPRGYRERVADWLRFLASKIDRRMTVAIEMRSDPALPISTKAACVVKGFRHAESLFGEQVKLEAVENGLKKRLPHLFEEV